MSIDSAVAKIEECARSIGRTQGLADAHKIVVEQFEACAAKKDMAGVEAAAEIARKITAAIGADTP